jgi:hypothetical protein
MLQIGEIVQMVEKLPDLINEARIYSLAGD